MQSPGPGPQDPDAETQRVHGTPAASRPDPVDPGSAEPYDNAERTRLVGDDAGNRRPGQAGGWPAVGQPPAGPGFPPVVASRPLNDPYGQADPYSQADPRSQADPYGRDDSYGGADPYGRSGPYGGGDQYGEEVQTRILPDGAGSGYPPGTSGGQSRNPGPEEYPPTAAYPPAGGYGAAPGAGGPSGPASSSYGGSPDYPPTGYPPPGGYPQPTAGYDQGYQQQGYPGPGYQQQGYPGPGNQQQGYQQQGYPTPGGYQQGYPPAGAYGAYSPPGSGPAGGPRPGGSGRRRAIIIGAAVVAVLLLIVIPVVLLTGGSDDGKPAAAASVSPSARPTAPASPSATSSASPSPSASAALTPAENELLAKLDSSAMTDCKPNSDAESDRIVAALYCDSDDGKVVAAYAYATAGDLTSDVDVRKALVTTPSGTCKDGGSEVFTWNFDQGKTQGTAVCTVRQSSHFIFWSYDDKLVSFMATGTDGVALYEWWSGFDPVPQS
ncbi:hypothetical protein [Frankia sp. ACN1ag]|uniref:hypothetical protein n=1 Tax=Frankia sp. ACN1ag TaxID=102891 RepID=UPI0006DD19BE|nr:hypothetical protein [Frankia sp. ACN1ag]KQC38921.1 hypothetical protein UK82_06785 [Frankia sp. ACN1ag]